jgi:VanZ family protein
LIPESRRITARPAILGEHDLAWERRLAATFKPCEGQYRGETPLPQYLLARNMIKLKKYRPFLIGTLALLSILFFFGGPDYHSPRSLKAMWNLGHILYFALLPLLVFLHPRLKAVPPRTQIFLIVGSTLVIGTIVKLLQYGLDRFPDIQDIYRNLIGAMVAVVFLMPIKRSIPKFLLNLFCTAAVLMMVTQLVPIAVALIDEHHARRDFPILSDFQSPF